MKGRVGMQRVSVNAARIAIGAVGLQMGLLAALHLLSPEFDPRWRVVSEYALGQYGWVLSLMFIADAISCWALALAVLPYVTSRGGRIGVGLLVAAGLGPAMASVFDLNHPLHEPAGLLGVLGLPIAAMVISTRLGRTPSFGDARRALLVTANLTWLSVVAFVVSMAVMIVTFLQAGGDMSAPPPNELPAGVIALVGWVNRLILVAGAAWVATLASRVLVVRGPASSGTRQLAAFAETAGAA